MAKKKQRAWDIDPGIIKESAKKNLESIEKSTDKAPSVDQEPIKVLKVHLSYHTKAKTLAAMQGSKMIDWLENLIDQEWELRNK
ncbi:MAG: hypothetical protein AAF731_07780 [Bacteroidota bacterium]